MLPCISEERTEQGMVSNNGSWNLNSRQQSQGGGATFFTKNTLYIKQSDYKSNLQRRSNHIKVLGPEHQVSHQEIPMKKPPAESWDIAYSESSRVG
jgi:hypothetical protein